MSRRPVGSGRRLVNGGSFPFSGSLHSKSKSSPLLAVALILMVCYYAIDSSFTFVSLAGNGWGQSFSSALPKAAQAYDHVMRGLFAVNRDVLGKVEGDFLCTLEVQRSIPVLKKAYGESMRKVLHVGLDTCSVVSKLVKEEETEAWGVEPYDIEDADASCKGLVRKGFVRVADIKFPLPYRPKSFSLVIVSDALDYLSPKYLNKTLPDLARISSDGLVAFTRLPGKQKAKVAEVSKFGRPAKLRSSSWWLQYFMQMSLEANEATAKKFELVASKSSYEPSCQIFHLKSYH